MVHYLTIIATIDKLNFSQVILKKKECTKQLLFNYSSWAWAEGESGF